MLLNSDAARIPLPDKSIHCVTTSPPYWGLRKYSGEQGRGMFPNLGLEPTPQEFISNMVEIFREVHRVLRDDGVVWMNLGDCFTGSGGAHAPTHSNPGISNSAIRSGVAAWNLEQGKRTHSRLPIRAGNLLMMPHRVAIALQDDGWIIRNDVVWFKRNPMPESVNGWRFQAERKRTGEDPRREYSPTHNNHAQRQHDGPDKFAQPEYEYGDDYELRKGSWRHTRAHEYVFQLVKGPKMKYWSNQEAVREITGNEASWNEYSSADGRKMPSGTLEGGVNVGFGAKKDAFTHPSGRNPRSVLDIPTAPYKGAHYATFPPNLIAPLIRATCPRWACPVCGQGWSPVVERDYELLTGSTGQKTNASDPRGLVRFSDGKKMKLNSSVKEYRPTCEHEHTIEEAVPGICLDPFIGSGTTGAVARELQRRWIGLDISMEYIDLQAKVRTKSGSPSNELEGLPLFERGNEDVN